ncbi:hypothetical protein PSACC_03302 [Paramicrosporidium saccamoebae]|uniref:Micro-fibrillar-associated protein 1 C-terminal domain-containing protein n=1 Tax=Paramicrosporidium saccamoebae TaxID=1246581 RepID=A0A2H9TGZ8_9FUNG|nr:hypothetical protein PSACC_03302 [Paramicrosporidium saccamoebae]
MSDARLQRLNALSAAKKTSTPATTTTRRTKIVAQVLYSVATKEKTEQKVDDQLVLRQQMKELALQRRLEEEQKQREETLMQKLLPEPTKEQEESWDEEESDDEGPSPLPLLRPVFVTRDMRHNVPAEEDVAKERKQNQLERQKEAHELLVEHVRREYKASVETKDDLEASNFDPDTVDDSDNVNIEEELQSWKLRELLRVKRDREERERWERDKMELERIRNMTEEERRQLDEEKMKEWMEQPQSQMRFMQKYYHKGAFFIDDDNKLLQRDYAQPTGEDASANREILPEVKQVRDFGKKGRTKWTHLVGEDTTAFDYGWGQRKNEMNYKMVSKMSGMKGHLDNPSKRSKHK